MKKYFLVFVFSSMWVFVGGALAETDKSRGVIIYMASGGVDQEAMDALKGAPAVEMHNQRGKIEATMERESMCQEKIEQFKKEEPPCTETFEDRVECAMRVWGMVSPHNRTCIEEVRSTCHEYCMVGVEDASIHLSCIVNACLYYIED